MNTCSTCRWWNQYRQDLGSCELTEGSGSPAHPESKAWAADSELYSAVLNTKPDFGCNQWDGKDEPR